MQRLLIKTFKCHSRHRVSRRRTRQRCHDFHLKIKVIRVELKNDADAKIISQIEAKYDFWTEIRVGHHVDILSPPDTRNSLQSFLSDHNIDWAVMISDVQSLIDLENISADGEKSNDNVSHSMDWTSFHPLEDIYGWFDYLEATYEFCESEIIGQTFEGRIMKVMKVFTILRICYIYRICNQCRSAKGAVETSQQCG